MSFEAHPRIIAFPVAELMRLDELAALYGAELPLIPKRADSEMVRCIAGGLDREGSTDLRALTRATSTTTRLIDGRHAYRAHWTHAVIAALEAGDVDGEEITEAEFLALLPPPPEL